MTSTKLREKNSSAEQPKMAQPEDENQEPQNQKRKTRRGRKFVGSDDEDAANNEPPRAVPRSTKRNKTKRRGRQDNTLDVQDASQPMQMDTNVWEEPPSMDVASAQERFPRKPPILASQHYTANRSRPPQNQARGGQITQAQHQPNGRNHQHALQNRQWEHSQQPPFRPRQHQDDDRSVGTWQGCDPPNRTITEDAIDRVHRKCDDATWGRKPTAGQGFEAARAGSVSVGGSSTNGVAFGPTFANAGFDSVMDGIINEAVAFATSDPPTLPTNASPLHDSGVLSNPDNCNGTTPITNEEPRRSNHSVSLQAPTFDAPQHQNVIGDRGPQQSANFNGDRGPQQRANFNGDRGPQQRANFNGDRGPQQRANFNGDRGAQQRANFSGVHDPPPSSAAWQEAQSDWLQVNHDDWGRNDVPSSAHSGRWNAEPNSYSYPQQSRGVSASAQANTPSTSSAFAAATPTPPVRANVVQQQRAAQPRQGNGFGMYSHRSAYVERKQGIDRLVFRK